MNLEPGKIFALPVLLAALLLDGCAATPRAELAPVVEQQRITELNLAIRSLRDDVDPHEARLAARIAYQYSSQLAREYEISDPPILHNIKVNLGIKPRGLCVDWTSDMLARLKQERFRSLDLHWGIANYEKAFRIEHSTAIISARGETLHRGLVLDPWRDSGRLFWSPTLADSDYDWKPQADVHAIKRRQKQDDGDRIYLR